MERHVLINKVLDEIVKDVNTNDLTATEELLTFVPEENLIRYLPDDSRQSIIDFTPSYKIGDKITFYSSHGIQRKAKKNTHGSCVFPTCEVTRHMLKMLDSYHSSTIVAIDDDGDVRFSDFPWTWPVDVISGYAPIEKDV